MSASVKTLARGGTAILRRFFSVTPRNSPVPRPLHLSPSNIAAHLLLAKLDSPPAERVLLSDAEMLKLAASPAGLVFPCGLPSPRFFIEQSEDAVKDEPLLLLPKRTYQPSTIRRKRTHGYLARKATRGGRKVIARRIAKGRARIAV